MEDLIRRELEWLHWLNLVDWQFCQHLVVDTLAEVNQVNSVVEQLCVFAKHVSLQLLVKRELFRLHTELRHLVVEAGFEGPDSIGDGEARVADAILSEHYDSIVLSIGLIEHGDAGVVDAPQLRACEEMRQVSKVEWRAILNLELVIVRTDEAL